MTPLFRNQPTLAPPFHPQMIILFNSGTSTLSWTISGCCRNSYLQDTLSFNFESSINTCSLASSDLHDLSNIVPLHSEQTQHFILTPFQRNIPFLFYSYLFDLDIHALSKKKHALSNCLTTFQNISVCILFLLIKTMFFN